MFCSFARKPSFSCNGGTCLRGHSVWRQWTSLPTYRFLFKPPVSRSTYLAVPLMLGNRFTRQMGQVEGRSGAASS
jgi:hypothetical protein